MLAVPLAVYGVAAASMSPGRAAGIGAAVATIEAGALSAVGGPDWGATLLALALAPPLAGRGNPGPGART